MKNSLCFISLLLFVSLVHTQYLTDKEYYKLPHVFHLDDYDKCMLLDDEAFYCTITYELEPLEPQNPSETWLLVDRARKIPRYYRHDKLRHGICVPLQCPNISKEFYIPNRNDTNLQKQITTCYNEKYKQLGLKGTVTSLLCETNEPFYKIDATDVVVGLVIVALLVLVTVASIFDSFARDYGEKRYKELINTKVGKVLICFSFPNNYRRLLSESTDEDAVRLKCIQGIRFYTTFCVILAHVCMVNVAVPLTNTKFNEDSTTKFKNMFVANGGYAVQTFFGISGMLTTYFFFKTYEKKKNVNIMQIVLAFINRYVRLTPVLLFMIALNATWMVHVSRGPIWHKIVGEEYLNCRNNWWTNILYINNYVNKENMCLQQTWYIACDTQVFIPAIFVTYLIFKYRQHVKTILITSLAISIIIPCAVNYYYDFGIITKHFPEPLYDILLNVHQWHIMFASGYTNMGGYMVGVIFGYVLYLHKNSNMLRNKLYVAAWWIVSYGLPLGIVFIASIFYKDDFHTTRILASLYVGFGRPIFTFGVLLGILGVIQGNGWVMKRVLETAPVQILGRISYCTFLVHVTIQRIRIGEVRSPVYASELQYLFQSIGDTFTTYIIGSIVCLMVEMPISALQKLYMPTKSQGNANKENMVAREENGAYKNGNGVLNKENGFNHKKIS